MTETKDITNDFMASLIITDFVDNPELSASDILYKVAEIVKDDKNSLFKIHNHLSREGLRNEEITELYHKAGNIENLIDMLTSDMDLKKGLETTDIYYDVNYTITTIEGGNKNNISFWSGVSYRIPDYILNHKKEYDTGLIEVTIRNAKNPELKGTYYSYFRDPESMRNASMRKKDEWLLEVIENKGFEKLKENKYQDQRLP